MPLLVRIEGSVSGLSQGSQVLFNGLGVGTVTNLRIDPNNPRVVIATTQIDRTTPVTTSTTATIGFAGLTGQGFIGLTGGNVNDRNIIQSALEQGATPVMTANPSDVTDILATARDIADRANNILSEFEEIVQAIGPSVRTTADNVARPPRTCASSPTASRRTPIRSTISFPASPICRAAPTTLRCNCPIS